MRVSEFYGLERNQAVLDFVDVDLATDLDVFVDPVALNMMSTPWAAWCRSLIQGFFEEVLTAIRTGDSTRAISLLGALHEPNETHLGLSRGRPRGHSMGPGLARKVHDSLVKSKAVQTGLIEDLSDTALMVDRIDRDVISDIATVLMREPLIAYTQAACDFYGIPVHQVDSGALWQQDSKTWINHYVDLPVADDGSKLLLVPKILVRIQPSFRSSEYYQQYLLVQLQEIHIAKGSSLVQVLKDGRHRVTKKDLIKRYGSTKEAITNLTADNPDVLDRYRNAKRRSPADALTHEELADKSGAEQPDWDRLLSAVVATPRGSTGATAFHRAAADLLAALFHPSLCQMTVEQEIHSGRKRIDILFTNAAPAGFFAHMSQNYGAPFIMVECKNYKADPSNPELDQLSGRFGVSRGRVGLLLCRHVQDRELFTARCRDTANDGRGYVIALDDDDLTKMVELRTSDALSPRPHENVLEDHFKRLVL